MLRRSMWFQHDGAPAHYTSDDHQHLNVTFGKHRICHGGLDRSPDLLCLDFFCRGQTKKLVCQTLVDSVEDVVTRISVAACL
ncbi:hypothetical protein AVEN_226148-1 [Araneus ventricosus]|uniref:Tc1-like transposase DDE domain-containing protein n=1 Tax=Araneus ventricosus TaxID=182803 RepID=A0A4Y2M1H2_ARAVE|nr:hypothetical protein AVEN_226148-1 [Araneus ventricosus]